jgi:hypothetical protein
MKVTNEMKLDIHNDAERLGVMSHDLFDQPLAHTNRRNHYVDWFEKLSRLPCSPERL